MEVSNVMRIGEFAALTGVSARMLRYYEQQGLLVPAGRDANGYRSYDETQAGTARRIRGLIDAGLPSRLVAGLLDTLTDAGGIYPEHVDPGTVQSVHDEWQRMCRCVVCMQARRDALKSYLDELRS